MAWRNILASSYYLGAAGAFVAFALILFWVLKMRDIQHLRVEIAEMEVRIRQGQEVWRSYPPLGAEHIRKIKQAQEKFHALPKDKDVPSLLQEFSRLARDYSLTDVTFKSDDSASLGGGQAAPPGVASTPAVVSAPSPNVSSAGSENTEPVASFPVKVGLAGNYRDIAYFLEALQNLPRLVRVQFLQLQRNPPLVVGEIVVHAYYLKGNLPEAAK